MWTQIRLPWHFRLSHSLSQADYNCLNVFYGVSSLKAIAFFFFFSPQWASDWVDGAVVGGRVDSFSAGECVCKEVKLASALGADELGTFQLTPPLNSLKTTDCLVPSLDLFVPSRLRCLLTPKLVCLANQLVPPLFSSPQQNTTQEW